MKQLISLILTYSFLISLSFFVLYISKPFIYIDSSKSQIVCNKSGQSFESGWNFIYTFADKLDSFNDTKARKLCEFNIIKDYSNTYKTPVEVNYRFEPKFIQESSWADAFFMFFTSLIIGGIIIKVFRLLTSSVKLVLLSFVIAPLIFFFIFRKPAATIFCKRQIARKVNNFKRIIFKYGIFPIPEEDRHIKEFLPNLYQKCLKNEGF